MDNCDIEKPKAAITERYQSGVEIQDHLLDSSLPRPEKLLGAEQKSVNYVADYSLLAPKRDGQPCPEENKPGTQLYSDVLKEQQKPGAQPQQSYQLPDYNAGAPIEIPPLTLLPPDKTAYPAESPNDYGHGTSADSAASIQRTRANSDTESARSIDSAESKEAEQARITAEAAKQLRADAAIANPAQAASTKFADEALSTMIESAKDKQVRAESNLNAEAGSVIAAEASAAVAAEAKAAVAAEAKAAAAVEAKAAVAAEARVAVPAEARVAVPAEARAAIPDDARQDSARVYRLAADANSDLVTQDQMRSANTALSPLVNRGQDRTRQGEQTNQRQDQQQQQISDQVGNLLRPQHAESDSAAIKSALSDHMDFAQAIVDARSTKSSEVVNTSPSQLKDSQRKDIIETKDQVKGSITALSGIDLKILLPAFIQPGGGKPFAADGKQGAAGDKKSTDGKEGSAGTKQSDSKGDVKAFSEGARAIDSKLLAQLQNLGAKPDVRKSFVDLIEKFQEGKLSPYGKEAGLLTQLQGMKPSVLIGLKAWLADSKRNPFDFKQLDSKTQQNVSKIFDTLFARNAEKSSMATQEVKGILGTVALETVGSVVPLRTVAVDKAETDFKLNIRESQPVLPADNFEESIIRVDESQEERLLPPQNKPMLDAVGNRSKLSKSAEEDEQVEKAHAASLGEIPANGRQVTYIVRSGETIFSIARSVLNIPDCAECLFHYNKENVFLASYLGEVFTIVLAEQELVIPSQAMIQSFTNSLRTYPGIRFDKQFENTSKGLISIFGSGWKQILAASIDCSVTTNLRFAEPRGLNDSFSRTPEGHYDLPLIDITGNVMVLENMDSRNRIVVENVDNEGSYLLRQEKRVSAAWQTIAFYEFRDGRSVRYICNSNGSRRVFQINLPKSVVREMAANDLGNNWKTYARNYDAIDLKHH